MSQTPTGHSNSTQVQYATSTMQDVTTSNASAYPPPAKRQRLSPDARSPPPQPPQTNGVYRSTGYGYQYPQDQQLQQHRVQSPSSFNSPTPFPSTTWQQQQQRANAASPSSSQMMMPPPPKPNKEEKEEKVAVDDFNDALFSSGVNLKDEENYMHNLYNTRHAGNDSVGTVSFTSTSSGPNSFHQVSQVQAGNALNGTMGSTMTEEEVEQELKHKKTQAARKKAELDQHELNNPFLLGNVLRTRIQKIAGQQGARLSADGMYIRVIDPSTKVGTDEMNKTGIVAAQAESKIEQNARLVDVFSLISLATAERVRGLLDESYGLARARRYGDNGRVPIDFKDVATGAGMSNAEEVMPTQITDTAWDQLPDGAADKPHTSMSFQSAVNNKLRALAKRDQEAEKARNKKREARRKLADATPAAADEPVDTSSQDTMSANAAGDNKITKKELARQQKEKASLSEAQAATSTNQTAAMMALGRKGKKYSWMAGGASSMPTNRYAKPATTSTPGSGAATPSRKDARTPVGEKPAEAETGMTWGAWRENSKGGQGIQVRDWLLVLERDGKQKKAWERTILRLNKPES